MKKIVGWVIFTSGALTTFVCFGAACFLFFNSFFKSGESAQGEQAFGLACAVIGIPFYFLARYGWRINHKASPQKAHQTLAQALGVQGIDNQYKQPFDPTETILAVIETIGYKALFFTQNRVIVANVEDSAPGWSVPLLLFLPNSSSSWSKVRRVKKLPPEEILRQDFLNYAMTYSGIQSVQIFRKFVGHKIRITAEYTAITPASLSYEKRMIWGRQNHQLESWLSQPWRWKQYASTLASVLQDKLELS